MKKIILTLGLFCLLNISFNNCTDEPTQILEITIETEETIQNGPFSYCP